MVSVVEVIVNFQVSINKSNIERYKRMHPNCPHFINLEMFFSEYLCQEMHLVLYYIATEGLNLENVKSPRGLLSWSAYAEGALTSGGMSQLSLCGLGSDGSTSPLQ